MLVHPAFLLGRAQTDPQNVRTSLFDEMPHFLLLRFRQRTERRTVGSSDLDAMPLALGLGKSIGISGRAAVKEMAVLRASLFAKGFHQFRAVDAPLHMLETLPASQPNQRHAVRDHQTRVT